MSAASAFRSLVPLAIGLLVGATGAILFSGSLPGEEGSPEEKARRLELDLKKAENRIAALEESGGLRHGGRRTVRDGLRDIAEDIRAGRKVSPDEVLRMMQPAMRDLSPLFDRMRIRSEQRQRDALAGEFARKYDLGPSQEEALKKWFDDKAEADAKRWNDLVAKDGVTFVELMRASSDTRPDDGLDPFMESMLKGDKLATFKGDRMTERAQRVEQEADMRTQRLNGIVGLDDVQQDQVFGIMARGSRDYDPGMKLEGIGGEIGTTPAGNSTDAVLAVLRPEQREAYQEEQARRRVEAEKDMEAIGLSLPEGWDLMDQQLLD